MATHQDAWSYVPDDLVWEPDVARAILENHGNLLFRYCSNRGSSRFLTRFTNARELVILAIRNYPEAIKHSPFMDDEIIDVCFEKYGLGIHHIPQQFRTESLVARAIHSNINHAIGLYFYHKINFDQPDFKVILRQRKEYIRFLEFPVMEQLNSTEEREKTYRNELLRFFFSTGMEPKDFSKVANHELMKGFMNLTDALKSMHFRRSFDTLSLYNVSIRFQ